MYKGDEDKKGKGVRPLYYSSLIRGVEGRDRRQRRCSLGGPAGWPHSFANVLDERLAQLPPSPARRRGVIGGGSPRPQVWLSK
jgi:hypothetical protein